MIENRHTISGTFEPIQTTGAEARWVGRDLSPEPAKPHRKRILIVEDEAPLRAILRMMLEMEGHQVSEASDGAEGLNLFKAGEFDLVITDYEMPVMQGNKLAVGIKLLAPSLPILMVTGSGKAQRDARNPVDALLSKPFTVGELRGTIGKLLAESPAPAECSAVPSVENSSVTFAAEGQLVTSLQA